MNDSVLNPVDNLPQTPGIPEGLEAIAAPSFGHKHVRKSVPR